MSKGINPIRKAILKKSLRKGNTYKQAMLDAGYSLNTATHRVRHSNKMLNVVKKELLSEADKQGIIDKAWEVVREGLRTKKVKFVLAQALTTKSMTDKRDITATPANEIRIIYATPQPNRDNQSEGILERTRPIPQELIDKLDKNIGNDAVSNDSKIVNDI